MRNGFALALSLGLVATPAIAHDTLPTKWCPAGNIVVTVGTFDFPAQTLVDYRTEHLQDGQVLGSECDSVKTCGIVDDWFWANEAAHEACTAQQLKSGLSTPSMPFVTHPAAFNHNGDDDHDGVMDHHQLYKFKSGVKGVCVVCKPATATPAPAESSERAR